MFMLLVSAGFYTYAINAAFVKRVIPQVKIAEIPHVPKYFLGHITFDGKPVPVADLSLIIRGIPSSNCLHTRVVLLNHSGEGDGLFGILAEKVTEALELDLSNFVESSIHPEGLPFLGPTLNNNGSAIQWLDVDKLYLFLRSETRPADDIKTPGRK